MKKEKTYEELLHAATFGECYKEKNKKFFWRFGTKTINKIKTSVIYYNYEFRNRLTQSKFDWLILDNPHHWNVFQGTMLRDIGSGHEIVYTGKMSEKFKINWQEFKNSIEELRKAEEIKDLNEKRIQYEFPFHMVDINQSPELSKVFEKLENLRCINKV